MDQLNRSAIPKPYSPARYSLELEFTKDELPQVVNYLKDNLANVLQTTSSAITHARQTVQQQQTANNAEEASDIDIDALVANLKLSNPPAFNKLSAPIPLYQTPLNIAQPSVAPALFSNSVPPVTSNGSAAAPASTVVVASLPTLPTVLPSTTPAVPSNMIPHLSPFMPPLSAPTTIPSMPSLLPFQSTAGLLNTPLPGAVFGMKETWVSNPQEHNNECVQKVPFGSF